MTMADMVFQTSTSTPLYSITWTPRSTGTYAGTCLFLITLATISRAMLALKQQMEDRFVDKERNRRYVIVKGIPTEVQTVTQSSEAKIATLTTERGCEETVRDVKRHVRAYAPWRLSTDLPRALTVTIISAIGYLLMLAIMTMNVGYFMSVLGGIFLGELLVGRYILAEE